MLHVNLKGNIKVCDEISVADPALCFKLNGEFVLGYYDKTELNFARGPLIVPRRASVSQPNASYTMRVMQARSTGFDDRLPLLSARTKLHLLPLILNRPHLRWNFPILFTTSEDKLM
jgi:hypothetical protein